MATPSALGDVQARAAPPGFWRLNGINTFWAVSQGLWNAIYILLAVSAAVAAPDQKELVVGRATAAGGVLAVTVPIAAGWLSDRTRSRWGRRTPWILGGTLVNLAGLLLLAWAGSALTIVAAYLVLQLGNNAAGAAFAGIVPDTIPQEKRGSASGLLNSAVLVGTVACLALVLAVLQLLGSTAAGAAASYLLIAALLAVTTVCSLALLREPPSQATVVEAAPPFSLRGFLANRDFLWVIATRFLQTLGIWTILPFVAFYFQDVVKAANFGAASDLWLLCVIGGGILPAVLCGYWSDRSGRRKAFVYASSGLQALVASVLFFTLVSDLPAVYGLGVLFGVGYGAYSAVDWALACDVLPDRGRSAGRDMAVFHVAYTLPQVLAAAFLAPVLHQMNQGGGTGGYRVVFASAAVWFILSTLMVTRIRGVR